MTRKEERLAVIRERNPGHLRMFERIYAGKPDGQIECIKAFCLDCNGFEVPLAETCDNESCPLWGVNPRRLRRQKAAQKSVNCMALGEATSS